MFTKNLVALSTAAALLVGGTHLNGADAQQPKPREAELEAKIKDLEKRVQQLEHALNNRDEEDGFGQLRRRFGQQNFDNLFEQLQREMDRDVGPGFRLDPRGFGGFTANKPRLGVELAPVADDLRERFKNDVKDGAYVMSVVPGSPAEKAGLSVGDAITAFNGKPVTGPKDLIDAVRNAPQGKNEVTVTRRGEALQLKVDLGEVAAGEPDDANFQGGWLRRGDAEKRGAADPRGNIKSRTEVKASALELNDELVKTLKLTDEQKKKMREVLDKHAGALNAEVAQEQTMRPRAGRRGGIYSFNMTGNVSSKVEKHVAEAEKELAGTLSADQIKQWAEYRKTHNSVSVQQSTVFEGTAGAPVDDTPGFGF
ncbi:MAG TPA: PDZ domain-containing protein [Planctomycetota bacterium]|nr:PDZ domain-containing protein [Planctomycetota bacterium]